MDIKLPVVIQRQPDYTTCGPTSLHAIYAYYGDTIDLQTVIAETPKLPTGGTLGVHLSLHALRRGYEVDTWVCNVQIFDPTWFQKPTNLTEKLTARFAAKGLTDDSRYGPALKSTLEYLSLGGGVHWGDMSPAVLGKILGQGNPLITGVNGNYLYQCIRETAEGPDDIRGDSFGHFIVLCGHDDKDGSISIADPLQDNPGHNTKYYRASVHRLIGAIFLGVSSDDGNLIRIRPKNWQPPR